MDTKDLACIKHRREKKSETASLAQGACKHRLGKIFIFLIFIYFLVTKTRFEERFQIAPFSWWVYNVDSRPNLARKLRFVVWRRNILTMKPCEYDIVRMMIMMMIMIMIIIMIKNFRKLL